MFSLQNQSAKLTSVNPRAGLGGGLSVAEVIERLAAANPSARAEIGWSWTTAPVASCDVEADGRATIEALLDEESRLKGFYALCIEDLAWAMKVIDEELPPDSRSKATTEAIDRAKWRIGILLKGAPKTVEVEAPQRWRPGRERRPGATAAARGQQEQRQRQEQG
jgi:hypothetical protein